MNTDYMTNRQLEGLLYAALKDLSRRNKLTLPPCESCGKNCKTRPSAMTLTHCPSWVWRKAVQDDKNIKAPGEAEAPTGGQARFRTTQQLYYKG